MATAVWYGRGEASLEARGGAFRHCDHRSVRSLGCVCLYLWRSRSARRICGVGFADGVGVLPDLFSAPGIHRRERQERPAVQQIWGVLRWGPPCFRSRRPCDSHSPVLCHRILGFGSAFVHRHQRPSPGGGRTRQVLDGWRPPFRLDSGLRGNNGRLPPRVPAKSCPRFRFPMRRSSALKSLPTD